jgi:hypothetical protein
MALSNVSQYDRPASRRERPGPFLISAYFSTAPFCRARAFFPAGFLIKNARRSGGGGGGGGGRLRGISFVHRA